MRETYGRTHVVYRLRNATGEVIYIGQTGQLTARMIAHRCGPMRDEIASVDQSNPMTRDDEIAAADAEVSA